MAKDPAALFYIDHWLVATREMRADCRGWYLNLVLHQFKSGTLPNDVEELANLASVRISEFDLFQQVWQQVLQQKFEVLSTGRLQDMEAAAIIRAREEFKDKRAASGRMSAFIKLIRRELCQDENVIFFVKKNVKDEQIVTMDQHVLKHVFRQMFQLYINTNKNKDKKEDVIGGAGGEEGEREGSVGDPLDEPPEPPPPGWNPFPGLPETGLELPQNKAKCALELLILNGVKAEMPHIGTLWEVFKNQNFTARKFYQNPDEVYSHFINWGKNQKINGTAHQSGGAHGKSAGAAELARKLGEKLTTRREPNPPG